jgi:hypothetical protein
LFFDSIFSPTASIFAICHSFSSHRVRSIGCELGGVP